MRELLTQLQEYLRMESELPFPEFQEYSEKVIKDLRENFETMSNEERFQARYICQIVGSNARVRSGKSLLSGKQFRDWKQLREINKKCQFWLKAIDYRLVHEGINKIEIDDMMKELISGLK